MAQWIQARFFPGQIVYHALKNYRAVVLDVDSHFMPPRHGVEGDMLPLLTEADRAQPWYYLLVDATDHLSYVAEARLHEYRMGDIPVEHPAVSQLFSGLSDGRYIFRHWHN